MSKDKGIKQQELLFSDPLPIASGNDKPKPDEKPKPKPERKINAWVPQMVNGEWEIF